MGFVPREHYFFWSAQKNFQGGNTCIGMYRCLSEPFLARRCRHPTVFNAVTCSPSCIFCFHFLKFKVALLTTVDRIQECQAVLRPASSVLGWWCWKWHLPSRPSSGTTELCPSFLMNPSQNAIKLWWLCVQTYWVVFPVILSSDKVARQPSRKPYCFG